jgi:hypothetical protein
VDVHLQPLRLGGIDGGGQRREAGGSPVWAIGPAGVGGVSEVAADCFALLRRRFLDDFGVER